MSGFGLSIGPDAGDSSILRAEFTPTTEFCPQSESLTVGAYRAWNGLADRHEYEEVLVRVSPLHNASIRINAELKRRESGEFE